MNPPPIRVFIIASAQGWIFDHSLRESGTRLFRREGLETMIRTSPDMAWVGSSDSIETAIPLIEQQRPDIVLLPWMYRQRSPVMLTASAQIKQTSGAPKVILLGALNYLRREWIEQALTAGIFEVITHLSSDEIRQIIRSVYVSSEPALAHQLSKPQPHLRVLLVQTQHPADLENDIQPLLQALAPDIETVAVVQTAEEALAKADLLTPHVIVIDWHLLDMVSGTFPAQLFKTQPNIPIIGMIASIDTRASMHSKTTNKGIDQLMTLPVNAIELYDKLVQVSIVGTSRPTLKHRATNPKPPEGG